MKKKETRKDEKKFFYPDHQKVVKASTKEEADKKVNKLNTKK